MYLPTKFYEIPSLPFKDTEKPKRREWMDGRSRSSWKGKSSKKKHLTINKKICSNLNIFFNFLLENCVRKECQGKIILDHMNLDMTKQTK